MDTAQIEAECVRRGLSASTRDDVKDTLRLVYESKHDAVIQLTADTPEHAVNFALQVWALKLLGVRYASQPLTINSTRFLPLSFPDNQPWEVNCRATRRHFEWDNASQSFTSTDGSAIQLDPAAAEVKPHNFLYAGRDTLAQQLRDEFAVHLLMWRYEGAPRAFRERCSFYRDRLSMGQLKDIMTVEGVEGDSYYDGLVLLHWLEAAVFLECLPNWSHRVMPGQTCAHPWDRPHSDHSRDLHFDAELGTFSLSKRRPLPLSVDGRRRLIEDEFGEFDAEEGKRLQEQDANAHVELKTVDEDFSVAGVATPAAAAAAAPPPPPSQAHIPRVDLTDSPDLPPRRKPRRGTAAAAAAAAAAAPPPTRHKPLLYAILIAHDSKYDALYEPVELCTLKELEEGASQSHKITAENPLILYTLDGFLHCALYVNLMDNAKHTDTVRDDLVLRPLAARGGRRKYIENDDKKERGLVDFLGHQPLSEADAARILAKQPYVNEALQPKMPVAVKEEPQSSGGDSSSESEHSMPPVTDLPRRGRSGKQEAREEEELELDEAVEDIPALEAEDRGEQEQESAGAARKPRTQQPRSRGRRKKKIPVTVMWAFATPEANDGYYVEPRLSEITKGAGLGLFAPNGLPMGYAIPILGRSVEDMTEKEQKTIWHRYTWSEGYNRNNGHFSHFGVAADPRDPGGVAGLFNEPGPRMGQPNMRARKGYAIAMRDIGKDEELTISYGREYKRDYKVSKWVVDNDQENTTQVQNFEARVNLNSITMNPIPADKLALVMSQTWPETKQVKHIIIKPIEHA